MVALRSLGRSSVAARVVPCFVMTGAAHAIPARAPSRERPIVHVATRATTPLKGMITQRHNQAPNVTRARMGQPASGTAP
eukprot:2752663-Prymnesium_polylepis.1